MSPCHHAPSSSPHPHARRSPSSPPLHTQRLRAAWPRSDHRAPPAGFNECPAKYGMCMVCSFVPFRSREHDENTLRTAHPAVIFASHMCLVCGWVWVLDMNTRQQYMKPFYTGTLDINRSQTVPDPGTIGAVPDSIISTNTIHAHHPACKVLQLHLPCTNPAFMQMECIVKT